MLALLKPFPQVNMNRRTCIGIFCDSLLAPRCSAWSRPTSIGLFEQASKDVLDSIPEVFRAPALPLGNDFNGIVHVHGAVSHPGGMVLTDKDFGRAYLTEGWARRFLVALFRHFTVLFVAMDTTTR